MEPAVITIFRAETCQDRLAFVVGHDFIRNRCPGGYRQQDPLKGLSPGFQPFIENKSLTQGGGEALKEKAAARSPRPEPFAHHGKDDFVRDGTSLGQRSGHFHPAR